MIITNEQRNNTMAESRRGLNAAIELRRLSGPLLTSFVGLHSRPGVRLFSRFGKHFSGRWNRIGRSLVSVKMWA